jgi:hypothetical protein
MEVKILSLTQNDIDIYLLEVKKAINDNRYRIEKNPLRQENINLFLEYILDESKAKDILINLNSLDFSEVLQNKNVGFEHEQLYVFGKNVVLLERFGNEEKNVPLYIKLNKLDNCFVIVISFHIQKYPIKYKFK